MERVAGYVTGSGARVCRACAAAPDLLEVHRVGALEAPIVHPAPAGVYLGRPESAHYDEPCDLCGWAIRAEKNVEGTSK